MNTNAAKPSNIPRQEMLSFNSHKSKSAGYLRSIPTRNQFCSCLCLCWSKATWNSFSQWKSWKSKTKIVIWATDQPKPNFGVEVKLVSGIKVIRTQNASVTISDNWLGWIHRWENEVGNSIENQWRGFGIYYGTFCLNYLSRANNVDERKDQKK